MSTAPAVMNSIWSVPGGSPLAWPAASSDASTVSPYGGVPITTEEQFLTRHDEAVVS